MKLVEAIRSTGMSVAEFLIECAIFEATLHEISKISGDEETVKRFRAEVLEEFETSTEPIRTIARRKLAHYYQTKER